MTLSLYNTSKKYNKGRRFKISLFLLIGGGTLEFFDILST
jgi:hypothetical protein